MGFSYRNRVIIVLGNDSLDLAQAWFDALPAEIETNVGSLKGLRRIFLDERLIVIDSNGYGVFELSSLDWPDSLDIATLVSASFKNLGPEGKAQVSWCDYDCDLKDHSWTFDPDDASCVDCDIDGMLSRMALMGDWSDDDDDADRLGDSWSLALQEAWESVYRYAIEKHLMDFGVSSPELLSLLSDPWNQDTLFDVD